MGTSKRVPSSVALEIDVDKRVARSAMVYGATGLSALI